LESFLCFFYASLRSAYFWAAVKCSSYAFAGRFRNIVRKIAGPAETAAM
jgi:hypothetical protein